MLDFNVKTGIRFSLRDKWLFEITEVEITRVDCTYLSFYLFIIFIYLFIYLLFVYDSLGIMIFEYSNENIEDLTCVVIS